MADGDIERAGPEYKQTLFQNCVLYGQGRDGYGMLPEAPEAAAVYANCVFYSNRAPWWVRLGRRITRWFSHG